MAIPVFPGAKLVADPVIDLRHEIDVQAPPDRIWPWVVQLGYHRAGWYIDTWWDRVLQQQFWPRVVPKEARGTYRAPAETILPEYQSLSIGDIIPDGPPGSAFYEVVEIETNRLLLLYTTSHFKYMAPRFVYRTRLAPSGAFCWAFLLSELGPGRSRIVSWWQADVRPRSIARLLKPALILVDGAHQRQILRGIKRRAQRER